jgi:hypothetical protein
VRDRLGSLLQITGKGGQLAGGEFAGGVLQRKLVVGQTEIHHAVLFFPASKWKRIPVGLAIPGSYG